MTNSDPKIDALMQEGWSLADAIAKIDHPEYIWRECSMGHVWFGAKREACIHCELEVEREKRIWFELDMDMFDRFF
jgi:hypothetical protein